MMAQRGRGRGTEDPAARTTSSCAKGRLAAVIDFGSSGAGDPACDTVIAWTCFSGPSRARFRAELGADAATWSRGRGRAPWKALITLVGDLEAGAPEPTPARRDLAALLAGDADGRW